MFILNSAQTESISFTIAALIGFLFFATLLYLLVFKPKYRDRILDAGDTPFNYLGEGGGGILLLFSANLIYVFLLFAVVCPLWLDTSGKSVKASHPDWSNIQNWTNLT